MDMATTEKFERNLEPPQMTPELVRRIERSEADYMRSRLERLAEREGNPVGVELETFGESIAWRAHRRTNPYYNRVMGLSMRDSERFRDIHRWFREAGIRCRIDMAPGMAVPDVMRWWAEHGYMQNEFGAVFCSMAKALPPVPCPGVEVHEIALEERQVFADVYLEGYNRPVATRQDIWEDVAIEYEGEGWRRYMAVVDGQPASVACMFIEDGVASLSSAATMPTFRGTGCHFALVCRRLNDAAEAGCDLSVSQAWFGSASFRNLQRAGMHLAYTKALWIAPPFDGEA